MDLAKKSVILYMATASKYRIFSYWQRSTSPELRSSSTPVGVAGYRFTFTRELRFAYTRLSIFASEGGIFRNLNNL